SQRAASGFDCSLCASSRSDPFQDDLARELARLDDLGVTDGLAHDARLLEHLDVDFVDGQTLKVGQTDFSRQMLVHGGKATLGQATLQRHLTAFKANLVEAAGTRLLTLVTTAGCFAKA